jgi:hypothetical protein
MRWRREGRRRGRRWWSSSISGRLGQGGRTAWGPCGKALVAYCILSRAWVAWSKALSKEHLQYARPSRRSLLRPPTSATNETCRFSPEKKITQLYGKEGPPQRHSVARHGLVVATLHLAEQRPEQALNETTPRIHGLGHSPPLDSPWALCTSLRAQLKGHLERA